LRNASFQGNTITFQIFFARTACEIQIASQFSKSLIILIKEVNLFSRTLSELLISMQRVKCLSRVLLPVFLAPKRKKLLDIGNFNNRGVNNINRPYFVFGCHFRSIVSFFFVRQYGYLTWYPRFITNITDVSCCNNCLFQL